MYSEKDAIKNDIRTILSKFGFTMDDFKIAIENGSSYDSSQIVATQIWITIERNAVKKRYGLYRTNWPHNLEIDLKNNYFS
jgi:hypothetical protein